MLQFEIYPLELEAIIMASQEGYHYMYGSDSSPNVSREVESRYREVLLHPVAKITYYLLDYIAQAHGEHNCAFGFSIDSFVLFLANKFAFHIEEEEINRFLQPRIKKYKTKRRLKEHADVLARIGLYPLRVMPAAHSSEPKMSPYTLLYFSSSPPTENSPRWVEQVHQRTRDLLWDPPLPPQLRWQIQMIRDNFPNTQKQVPMPQQTQPNLFGMNPTTPLPTELKEVDLQIPFNADHLIPTTPSVEKISPPKGKQKRSKIPQDEYVLKPIKCPETEDFVLNYLKLLETGTWGGKYDKEKPPVRFKLCRRGGGRPTHFQRIVLREGSSKSNLKRKRREMREGVGRYVGSDRLEFLKTTFQEASKEFTEVSRQQGIVPKRKRKKKSTAATRQQNKPVADSVKMETKQWSRTA